MRSWQFIAVTLFLVLLIGGAGAVWAYDASRDDKIADGVTVAGIMLGGLDREQAREKLERELLAGLRTPVVAVARHRRYRLSADDAPAYSAGWTRRRSTGRSRIGQLIAAAKRPRPIASHHIRS